MAAIAVTTTPVQFPAAGDAQVVIQNLGAGDLYIGSADTVSSSTGIKIVSGGDFTSPADLVDSGGVLWLVSASTSDVRWLRVG